MEFSVQCARSVAELSPFIQDWRELEEKSLEPNAFYGPDLLLPAMQWLSARNLQVLLVFGSSSRSGIRTLHGIFPVKRRLRCDWLPLPTMSLWQHLHCFLCVPLLRAEAAPECLDAFLDWTGRRCALMQFRFLSADGAFYRLLRQRLHAKRRAIHFSLRRERAILVKRGDADSACLTISPERRRTLSRKRRRLAEKGPLAFRYLQSEEELASWIDGFLQLEQSGWKGRAGTALSCRPVEREFFSAAVREAFFSRRLIFVRLELAGQAIAYRVSFVSGSAAFAFKSAFDEEFGYYSPGALLELETIAHLDRTPELRWMDSCAESKHSLLDNFWRDRRRLLTLTIAGNHRTDALALETYRLLGGLRKAALGPERRSPCPSL